MNINAQPLVSVLTPVYNGEKYLTECIESVLAQTYQNWEYIIVNNCSTDRTLEIAYDYAQKDTRICIHNNQRFVGLIQNHNVAFRQVSTESKYCKMVHADDWLMPECIMQMVQLAEMNPSVGIVGAYRLNGDRVSPSGLPYPSTVVPGRDICRRILLGGGYGFGSPTSTLIRSNLIRSCQMFYNESNRHADKEAFFKVLQTSDLGFVHQVLTYTRRHNEASTSFSMRFNTYILSNFLIIKKYGPIYLDREEYEECLKREMKHYYAFLARNALHLREKEFWNYHKDGLKKVGMPFSRYKLATSFFLALMDLLLNPKMTLQKMTGRITRTLKAKPSKGL